MYAESFSELRPFARKSPNQLLMELAGILVRWPKAAMSLSLGKTEYLLLNHVEQISAASSFNAELNWLD
jgi:hypothetical protein